MTLHATPVGTRTPGRTRITERALTRVASAVSAEALGVSPGQMRVHVEDVAGLLALTVRGPIRVPPLGRLQPGTAPQSGSLLERCARAQTEIRDRVAELTGASVGSVTVRVTGVELRREVRVR
jgi:hypothetical protein